MNSYTRYKQRGFTLTELMVVTVILCCLATWVPFAWFVPDKVKDLKALEHLRAHAYMHQMYFGMFRDYPDNNSRSELTEYAHIIIKKVAGPSTRFFDSSILDADPDLLGINEPPQHNLPLLLGETSLNTLTLDNDPSLLVTEVILNNGSGLTENWKLNPLNNTSAQDTCLKNTPIAHHSNNAVEEDPIFCEILDRDDVAYRTITVGSANPPVIMLPGTSTMIPHRCMGLIAPSGTIYIMHIAGGETLSTSHIPSQRVKKFIEDPNQPVNPLAATELLIAALHACEDPTTDLATILAGAGYINANFPLLASPGF